MRTLMPAVAAYGKHVVEEDDIEAVCAVLRGEYLTTGPVVEEFEMALASKVGSRFAVACSSGTAGLHLATLSARLGPGDVVIVPAITFVATANAARLVGAEVRFADVDPDSGLMCVGHLDAAVGDLPPNTVKAVFAVHLNGQNCDMAGIGEYAKANNLTVIEDACHALGATHPSVDDRICPVGSPQSHGAVVFSFHPVKSITMGEGGAISTDDVSLYQRMRLLRNHGINREPTAFVSHEAAFSADGSLNRWYYETDELGLNYRASDIHCALGLSQLGKLDRFIERRRALARRYNDLLTGLDPVLRPVRHSDWRWSAWHLYVVLIDFDGLKTTRSAVMAQLHDRGIGTQVHYIPVYRHPYYEMLYGKQRLPGAERYYANCLSLPLHAGMKTGDVDFVVNALEDLLGGRTQLRKTQNVDALPLQ